MSRRIPQRGLAASSVVLFLVALAAEFRASLYGAGADTPIHEPALLKVQLGLGFAGLVVLAFLINALATGRRHGARVAALAAAVTWGVWIALGLLIPGGGWP